jgi:hypothetical protein
MRTSHIVLLTILFVITSSLVLTDANALTIKPEEISMGSELSYHSTMTDSPLKQFNSGIAANNVTCKQDLELIFKAEDGTPACVSQQTGIKLIQIGWAVQTMDYLKPWMKINTLGLNDTYIIGQPIIFSVNVQGFGYTPCDYPQVEIYDNKNPSMLIFHGNAYTMSCANLMAFSNYSFDFPGKNDHYVTSINKTGDYTLSIFYANDSIKKYFSVILP